MDEQCHGQVAHLAKTKHCQQGAYLLKKPSNVQKEFPCLPSGGQGSNFGRKIVVAATSERHNGTMHYCSAPFCYLREMSTKFSNHCQLECMDDKHICKVAEPGLPVTVIERGKQVVVSNNGKIVITNLQCTA